MESRSVDASRKGRTGLKRIWYALRYSIEGLAEGVKRETAFRQEAALAALLIGLAVILPVGVIGKSLMIFSVLLVLVVELLNSAIEATVDRISLEPHHLAKRAKDFGSAAVFIALVNVVIVWGLVLLG